MALGEIGGADSLPRMIEYTQGERRLHTAYSFALLGDRHDPAYIASCLEPWSDDATGAARAWPSWAVSNHDTPRVASRWGDGGGGSFAFGGVATLAAVTDRGGAPPELHLALLAALRGTIFLYQGEELGLPQSEIDFADLQDPFGKAHWPLNKGRDGCRTPFPWRADEVGAGFSSGKPWLPLDPAHRGLAVDVQDQNPASTLAFTRALLKLRRQHAALRTGTFDIELATDSLLLVRRRAPDETLWLAFNLGNDERHVPVPQGVRASLLAVQSATVHGEQVHLPPHSALFLLLAP
jgi:alpha-glucosidase